MKVVGFAGYSGSGKTTLVEQLIPELRLHGLAALLLVRLRRVVRGFSKKSAHKLRKPVSRFGQKAALFAFFGFPLPVIRFNRGIVSAGGRRRRPSRSGPLR